MAHASQVHQIDEPARDESRGELGARRDLTPLEQIAEMLLDGVDRDVEDARHLGIGEAAHDQLPHSKLARCDHGGQQMASAVHDAFELTWRRECCCSSWLAACNTEASEANRATAELGEHEDRLVAQIERPARPFVMVAQIAQPRQQR